MTESVHDYMTRLGQAARQASRVLARASTAQKNRALQAAANALDAARAELTAANELIWPLRVPVAWSQPWSTAWR